MMSSLTLTVLIDGVLSAVMIENTCNACSATHCYCTLNVYDNIIEACLSPLDRKFLFDRNVGKMLFYTKSHFFFSI